MEFRRVLFRSLATVIRKFQGSGQGRGQQVGLDGAYPHRATLQRSSSSVLQFFGSPLCGILCFLRTQLTPNRITEELNNRITARRMPREKEPDAGRAPG